MQAFLLTLDQAVSGARRPEFILASPVAAVVPN